MLLLQRRVGESIFIGDDIKITVLDASHRQVRLGIQAPRDVAVHREEIYQRIQIEKAGQGYNPDADNKRMNGQDYQQDFADAEGNVDHSSQAHYQERKASTPKITNKRDAVKSRAAHPFRRNMQLQRED